MQSKTRLMKFIMRKLVTFLYLMIPLSVNAALSPEALEARDRASMESFVAQHPLIRDELRYIDIFTRTVFYGEGCFAEFTREKSFHLPGWVGPQGELVFAGSNCDIDYDKRQQGTVLVNHITYSQEGLTRIPKGKGWLGLYCEQERCFLKDVEIKTQSQTLTDILGANVKAHNLVIDGNPVALIFGLKLATGKIRNSDISNYYSEITNTGRWQAPENDEKFAIIRESKDVLDISNLTTELSHFEIYAIESGRKQFLFSEKNGPQGITPASLLWSGDLDDDGKTDLIFNRTDGSCFNDYRLYLSSYADKRQKPIMGLAAAFEDEEPACGC